MDKERINALVTHYNAGVISADEREQLEMLIEKGLVDIESLNDLNALSEQLVAMETKSPGSGLDDRFYQMMSREKKSRNRVAWRSWFTWPQVAPALAFASVTLIAGVAIGFYSRQTPVVPQEQAITELTNEVSHLKEMVMFSLLEKESATDRLKAVSLTEEMGQVSHKVTKALIETLNHDENVNVRLAALDALQHYANDGAVREALIRSIPQQDSPLVQVALAELMGRIQAKSSVKELQKILENDRTPGDVRHKIKQSIDILI